MRVIITTFFDAFASDRNVTIKRRREYLRANPRARAWISVSNITERSTHLCCLLIQGPLFNAGNVATEKGWKKMENNAKTVPRLLPERREETRREKNRIKVQDNEGKKRMERCGVTTLAWDFSGRRAIKNARKTTLRYKPREALLIFSILASLLFFFRPSSELQVQ